MSSERLDFSLIIVRVKKIEFSFKNKWNSMENETVSSNLKRKM